MKKSLKSPSGRRLVQEVRVTTPASVLSGHHSPAPPALEKESAPKKGSKVWDYPHYDPKIHGGKDDEAEEGPFSRVIEDVDKSGEISAHRGVSSHGPATEHPAGDGIDDTEREKGTGNEEEEGSASDGGDRDRQSHGGHHQQR